MIYAMHLTSNTSFKQSRSSWHICKTFQMVIITCSWVLDWQLIYLRLERPHEMIRNVLILSDKNYVKNICLCGEMTRTFFKKVNWSCRGFIMRWLRISAELDRTNITGKRTAEKTFLHASTSLPGNPRPWLLVVVLRSWMCFAETWDVD